MADIVFGQYEGDVVRVNGKCYYYIGMVKEPVTTDPSEIEGVFSDCEDCAKVSSSSSSGGYSSSSQSDSSSSQSESSSSQSDSSQSESSSSSEGYSESSSSSAVIDSSSSSSESAQVFIECNCDSGDTNPRVIITVSWTDSDTQKTIFGCTFNNGDTFTVCPDTYNCFTTNPELEEWEVYVSFGDRLRLLGQSYGTAPYDYNRQKVEVHYLGNANWSGGAYNYPVATPTASTTSITQSNISTVNLDPNTWSPSERDVGDKLFGQVTTTQGVTIKWERNTDYSWGC